MEIEKVKKKLKELGISNYLDLSLLTDLYPSEDNLKDVELGESVKCKSPDDCQKIFAEQGRRAMTLLEVLNQFGTKEGLVDYLENHNFIDCAGSRYDSDGVPCLYLNDDGPELNYNYSNNASSSCGSASISCGSQKLVSRDSDVGNLEDRVLELENKMAKLIKIINNINL